MFRQFLIVSLLLISVTTTSYAFEIGAPINASTPITNTTPTLLANGISAPKQKPIVLMNIKLTPEERSDFLRGLRPRRSFKSKSVQDSSNQLPAQVNLGMNGVPVLEQGKHGTCVTFAVTGAIDALINRGDHISQLCALELAQYLEPRSFIQSGWNGSLGYVVINNLLTYGYIKKSDQIKKSCAGVKDYPTKDESNIGQPMTLDDYRPMSKNLDRFGTFTILTLPERLEWTEEDALQKSQAMLDKVKSDLAKPEAKYNLRITFGAILPFQFCKFNGACGKYHKQNDTWVLTDAIIKEISSNPLSIAGHEMIITGYNDDATAVDEEGSTHKGLLTLRNSWGADTGDNGNFYMTYDYFRFLTDEVQEITFVYKGA